MSSATESSLLSKLESSSSSTAETLFPLFSNYLHPFSDLTNHQIRPLAKQFLPFLNRALSILPKRLSSSDPRSSNDRFALDLLNIYQLCLTCLDSLSSQLSCKPYSVHVQRVRLLHCMEGLGRYRDAEAEGFRVLESFRGMDFGVKVKKSANSAGKFVPDVEKSGGDKEFALLVVEVVATMVKCAALGQRKDEEVYRRVIGLVEEVRPWFRYFEVENTGIEYVELVSYCANKCRTSSANLRITMATHLNKIAGDSHQVRSPFDMILRLYAAGLHLINSDAKSRGAIRILHDDGDLLQNLPALLGSLGSYFHISCKENCVTCNVKHTDSVCQSCSQLSSGYEASIDCTQNDRKAYLLFYLNALKFLCQPLADLVNFERKQLVSENDDAFITTKLCIIQDAFYQFADIFHSCQSCIYEGERDGFDENSKAVISVAIAAFTLSARTKLKMKKPKGLEGDISEDAIIEFVNEACTRSAFLLDVLHQCDSHKVKRTIAEVLEDWSVPGEVFEMLSGPVPLVKQWVKIECKRCTSMAEVDSAPTLYCLLSSSVQVSKRTIGIILEQELLAYEEMNALYPEFCQQMQMKIIGILLQDREVYGETCSCGIPTCHQLAVTYCLRALCTQEAEPNSKQIFQDINAALQLWLSISIPDHCSADELGSMLPENTLLLLYNIIDMLSLKGCMDFHHDIYKLITRLFKCKNVPLENFLAKLWESRRTSHALCISPVNETLIINLSEQYGDLCKSVDFWIRCLKGSHPLLVGFQQSFSFSFVSSQSSSNLESTFRSDITVDEVREAAFQLISSVPVPSQSVFLAGYLYYDLCERLVSHGRLIEALLYAKEAHQLRTRLFQEKFMYSVEQHTEKYNETGDVIQKLTYGLKNLQIRRSIATEIWSFDTIQWDLEGCYLSPWNVLQCYLESTLQIGIIHEITGNGAEAETFLIWGKNISCSQGLPLFIVAFSSVLGKLYRKKQLWDLAEKELQSAKKVLMDTSTTLSCIKCRLMMEATLDHHLGDLSRSNSDSTTADTSVERLSHAENQYKLALDKLDLPVWKNCVSCPEMANAENAECVGSNNSSSFVENDRGTGKSTREAPKAKMDAKKSRKNAPKPLLKDQCLIAENNSRVTRSRYRSTQNLSMKTSGELQVGLSRCLKDNNGSDCSDTLSQKELLVETNSCIVSSGCEVKCIPDKMSGACPETAFIEATHWHSWNEVTGLLGHGCPKHENALGIVEISRDAFTIERAAILFNISWFSLKSYHSKDTRTSCCDLFDIHLPKLVSWLMLAFVLCSEVPILFQKVSKLLATIYVLSASTEFFPLSPSCKALSENHWASYFHQASLGTHLNYQFFSNMIGRCKVQHLVDAEGSHVTGCGVEETSNLIRLAPDSIKDLEEFVAKFFVGLPCMTVICISLLGGAYASLVKDLLCYPTCVHAWMLVSRLNSKRQPVVVLLPVDPVIEDASDDDANSGSDKLYKSMDLGEHWHCPWGSTVVDDVAPVFKLILEENYLSSSMFPLEDTKRNRTLWWMWRKKLDCRLGKLLSFGNSFLRNNLIVGACMMAPTRNIEDSWLGPWKYLLLGEWSNRKRLDIVYKKLVHDLKSKCKLDVNESLLKVILGGSKYAFEGEACISQQCLRSGCYVGRVGYCNEAKFGTLSNASNGVDKQSELALQLIQDAANELEGEDSMNREPIILVLDCEVQGLKVTKQYAISTKLNLTILHMLPWENLPVLRNQEVYRMPSVGSISETLDRSHHRQEQVGRICATFPLIDPVDAFYLLNPSGDLSSTQVEFENWFRDHNLEGKAGSAPTAEELVAALKSHDLFIYFGHGSGAQYIPRHEIQKLENCAATLLMGCSSGSLTLNGSYVPQGTPLSYLLAGSPVIVANLWEVTDKDIDRFGKAMLDAWLRERSSPSLGCAQCDLVVEEFEAMTIRGCKGNVRRKNRRKKSPEAHDTSSFKVSCDHGPKIGSFMSQAREACTLPFLIGASPVCYGIPTDLVMVIV
ncbi:separase [Quercus suber]|uniref:separase n=1 Tax=Quercus suber TaxID=58331 RepID=A0AAW0KLS5_QUESU